MKRLLFSLFFIAGCQAQSWYNASWSHREVKAINHNAVPSSLTGFPVLVDLTADTALLLHARSDRFDVVFTSATGTKLPRARIGITDKYWVKTDVSATADTVLLVYAGNAAASNQDDSVNVWDSHFKFASDCEGGVCSDLTGSANNASAPTGTPTTVTGQIGSGVNFDGSSWLSAAGNVTITGSYTVCHWISGFRNSGRINTNQLTISIPGLGAFAYDTSSGIQYTGWYHGGAGATNLYRDMLKAGTWHYVCSTYDGTTVSNYLDGLLQQTTTSGARSSTAGIVIGSDGTNQNYRGSVDEIQISDSVRSLGWMSASQLNQTYPARFVSTGPLQTQAGASGSAPVVGTFTSEAYIRTGEYATLSWLVDGAASISINQGVGSQSVLNSGSVNVSPSTTTIYTITATNGNGSTQATTTVTVVSATGGPYLRSSTPPATFVVGYTNTTPPTMATGFPHQFVAGDHIGQHGICTNDPAHTYASSLNGTFRVKAVVDATHYTITDLAGADVVPNGDYCTGSVNVPPYLDKLGGATMAGKVQLFPWATGPKGGGFDGYNGPAMRQLALSTDNGLSGLVVSSNTATASTTFAPFIHAGDKISVWNSTSSPLNAEWTVASVGTNSYTFTTSGVSDGTYTHNDTCGPDGLGGIGGTENCVVISQQAVSTSIFWGNIVTKRAGWVSSTDYELAYDNPTGSSTNHPDTFGWTMHAMAIYFLVDRKDTTSLAVGSYALNYIERACGVSCAVGNGTNYVNYVMGVSDASNWQAQFALLYAAFGRYLTSAQRTTALNKLYNDVNDPAAYKTPNAAIPQVIATGTAQGGDGTHIILAASDTAADGYYVNNVVEFNAANSGYAGFALITAYVASTKTATISTSGGYTWPRSPLSSDTYDIYATAIKSAPVAGVVTITGYNTTFNSWSVGDAIQGCWDTNAPWGRQGLVTAIATDTSMSVIVGQSDCLSTTVPKNLWRVPKWDATKTGFVWFTKSSTASQFCPPIAYNGSCSQFLGGTPYGRSVIGSNTSYTITASRMALGAAAGPDDARAQRDFEEAFDFAFDNNLAFSMQNNTAFSQSGAAYSYERTLTQAAQIAGAIKYAVTGFPDMGTTTGDWVRQIAIAKPFMQLPDHYGGSNQSWGATFGGTASRLEMCARCIRWNVFANDPLSWLNPAAPEVQRLRDWFVANSHWSSAYNNTSNAAILLAQPPNIVRSDYTVQPSQYIFGKMFSTDPALSLSLQGRDYTAPYSGVVSLSSWGSATATHVMILGKSYWADHDWWEGASLRISKVGPLLGVDAGSSSGESDNPFTRGDGIYIASTAGRQAASSDDAVVVRPLRWASANHGAWESAYGDASSRYAYVALDEKDAYAVPPNRAVRHFVHFKKPGTEEVIVDFVDVDASNLAVGTIRTSLHYRNRGLTADTCCGYSDAPNVYYTQGNTTCTSCNTNRFVVSSENGAGPDAYGTEQRNYQLLTRFLSPGTICVSDDGTSYSGAAGYSHRVSVYGGATCGDGTASSQALEAVIVHKVTTLSDSSLTATPLNPNANWTGVTTADKVFLIRRGGALDSGVPSFSAPANSQVLVSGLPAGTYDAYLSGVRILSSGNVSDGDNTLYFETTGAGTISIINGRGGSTVRANTTGRIVIQ